MLVQILPLPPPGSRAPNHMGELSQEGSRKNIPKTMAQSTLGHVEASYTDSDKSFRLLYCFKDLRELQAPFDAFPSLKRKIPERCRS